MNEQDTISTHYLDAKGQAYYTGRFDKHMEFGRLFQTRYFPPYCDEHKDILDFGSATGFCLRSLPARRRIGVEVNPHCVEECRALNQSSAKVRITESESFFATVPVQNTQIGYEMFLTIQERRYL